MNLIQSYVLEKIRAEFRDLGLKYSNDNMNVISLGGRVVFRIYNENTTTNWCFYFVIFLLQTL
jgi:hypothetical protein